MTCRSSQLFPCHNVHTAYRYSDASAAWVLVASILIFFMASDILFISISKREVYITTLLLQKAGFMLVEAAFVADRADRRSVILFVSL